MNYIGIDPGLHGAVGLISPDEVFVWDTPLIGRVYDSHAMAHLFNEWRGSLDILVIMEQASTRPMEGVRSSWTNGYGYGLWQGILAAYGIPYRTVSAKTWKRSMGLTQDKEASRSMARRMFPNTDLSLKKHHGRAEALLIAEYGGREDSRRHHNHFALAE